MRAGQWYKEFSGNKAMRSIMLENYLMIMIIKSKVVFMISLETLDLVIQEIEKILFSILKYFFRDRMQAY